MKVPFHGFHGFPIVMKEPFHGFGGFLIVRKEPFHGFHGFLIVVKVPFHEFGGFLIVRKEPFHGFHGFLIVVKVPFHEFRDFPPSLRHQNLVKYYLPDTSDSPCVFHFISVEPIDHDDGLCLSSQAVRITASFSFSRDKSSASRMQKNAFLC